MGSDSDQRLKSKAVEQIQYELQIKKWQIFEKLKINSIARATKYNNNEFHLI